MTPDEFREQLAKARAALDAGEDAVIEYLMADPPALYPNDNDPED